MLRTSHQISLNEIVKIAGVFQLLHDEVRLKIMFHLMDQERNVSWLCRELNIPQPTASHHLGLLRRANLVKARRAGKIVYYSVACSGNRTNTDFRLTTPNWALCLKILKSDTTNHHESLIHTN